MRTETLIWALVLVLAGGWIVYRAGFSEHGMGKAYVRADERTLVHVEVDGEERWIDAGSERAAELDPDMLAAAPRVEARRQQAVTYSEYRAAVAADPAQERVRLSFWRTFGVWVAAFFTLAILSFIYRDNPFYKFAESVFVGVSAAYWMVVGFWDVLVPNLFGKLWPMAVQAWAMPGLAGRDLEPTWTYIVPLVLGIMLVWRLSPVGGWIARWPLAFIIGVFCGLRLIGFLHGDFINQIRNGIVPLAVFDPASGMFDIWGSIENILLVLGVLACLVYFFFSVEHKGVVGRTARVGIWVLMITFGAGFGYTVMGRIALLAIRLEFLFDDWLWLIDPTNKRDIAAAVGLM
jgi:hypothetical protein